MESHNKDILLQGDNLLFNVIFNVHSENKECVLAKTATFNLTLMKINMA